MAEAIIFDMDGVLINSTKYIWESFNALLKNEGIHFSNKDIKKYLGKSLRDNLQSWKKEYGIKDYSLEEFSKQAGEMELSLAKKELHPNKKLNYFLEKAKEKVIKLAVATSSLRWRAEKILNLLNIRRYLDILVTAEDVEKHKPHPEIFLEAAKQLGVPPENCVVIEDAKSGIKAAKAGGMKAIGLINDYNSKKELREADLIIKDLSELNIEMVKSLT